MKIKIISVIFNWVEKMDEYKEKQEEKEWCEVGEHECDFEDHWSSIPEYSTCGDCMDCTSLKDIKQ